MKGFHYTINDNSPGFNYNGGNVSPGFNYNRGDVSSGFNYNRYDGMVGFKYNRALTPIVFSTKIFNMKTNDNKPYLTSHISEQVFDMFLASQEPEEPTERHSFNFLNQSNIQKQPKINKGWEKSKKSKQNNNNNKVGKVNQFGKIAFKP